MLGLLVVSSGEAIANKKKPPCSYPIEVASDTDKVYRYPKFGISMVMPDNLVSMLLQDGSIDIMIEEPISYFNALLVRE